MKGVGGFIIAMMFGALIALLMQPKSAEVTIDMRVLSHDVSAQDQGVAVVGSNNAITTLSEQVTALTGDRNVVSQLSNDMNASGMSEIPPWLFALMGCMVLGFIALQGWINRESDDDDEPDEKPVRSYGPME